MITLKTTYGDIKIELDHENTPITAKNFLSYAQEGFYNGTIFHRVINNFMIQGGGFEAGMQQKATKDPIENEADKGGSNVRGAIAMARTDDPHSATAQFFINVVDNNFLNHTGKSATGWGYCVFGNVVEGMEIVDKIKAQETTSRNGHQDVPVDEILINEVIVEDSAN